MQEAVLDENAKPLPVEKLSIFLQKMATDYLQSSSHTDKKILETGKLNKTVFDDVLSYMNVIPHTYCIYVYEELYCRDKITVEEAMNALHKFANDETDYMSSLIWYDITNEIKIDFGAYNQLQEAGYLYLNEFIQNEINMRLRSEADNKIWKILFRKKDRLTEEMNLAHFYITRIEYHDTEETYYLDIIFKAENQGWYALVVVCDQAHFSIILQSSKYAVQNSIVRANFENGVKVLDLKNSETPQLEINLITLKLFLLNHHNKSMKGYYGISCYNFSISEMVTCIDAPMNRDLPF